MSNSEQSPGCLYVVATPIGNLGDMSSRALEVLRSVDRIVAEDTRHTRGLLQHFGIQTSLLAMHEHNEISQLPFVLERLQAGENIALVSDAGTPLISDPGFPLVRACREEGIPVVGIPGPSAIITALSIAGLPTDRFAFEGFLPRKRQARLQRLEGLAAATATLVFYEASHRIEETLQDMQQVFGSDRYVVIARELTKLHETVLQGSLTEVSRRVCEDENQRKGEFVVMLAGAEVVVSDVEQELDRVLGVLLEDLPLKQAAALAARLAGVGKNVAYQRALLLSGSR